MTDSASVNLAERSRVAAFTIVEPAPTDNNLVAVEPRDPAVTQPATVLPEQVEALLRRSGSTLRSVEVAGGDISRRRIGLFSGLVMAGSGIAAFFAGAVGAVTAAVEATGLDSRGGLGVILLGVGTVAAGILAATNYGTRARANSELKRELTSELEIIERAGANAAGLERAWIARRAMDIATVIGAVTVDRSDPNNVRIEPSKGLLPPVFDRVVPGLESTEFVQRLMTVARAWGLATPEERGEVELVHEIYGRVFDLSALATHNDATRGASISRELEVTISKIEALTSAGRALLGTDVIDAIVLELGKDKCNRYRIQRVLDAASNTRTPYSTEVPEIGARELELDALRKARGASRDAVHADADGAIHEVTQQLLEHSQAQVKISTSAMAERVAAFFELKRLRAALYEGNEKTFVTVYDPQHPPMGGYVTGEHGRDGPRPVMQSTGPR